MRVEFRERRKEDEKEMRRVTYRGMQSLHPQKGYCQESLSCEVCSRALKISTPKSDHAQKIILCGIIHIKQLHLDFFPQECNNIN